MRGWKKIVRGWKTVSILSLTLAPNLCERMEKNCERMERKFHPLTGIGAKIVRGWKCLDLSCI
jgi:hypothetical protein